MTGSACQGLWRTLAPPAGHSTQWRLTGTWRGSTRNRRNSAQITGSMADQNTNDTEKKFYSEILRSLFLHNRDCLVFYPRHTYYVFKLVKNCVFELSFFLFSSCFLFFVHMVYWLAKFPSQGLLMRMIFLKVIHFVVLTCWHFSFPSWKRK